MYKVLEKLEIMSSVFFVCLVLFENFVIKIVGLIVVLVKLFFNDLNGFNMEDGFVKFKLLSNLGDMGGGDINLKVRN